MSKSLVTFSYVTAGIQTLAVVRVTEQSVAKPSTTPLSLQTQFGSKTNRYTVQCVTGTGHCLVHFGCLPKQILFIISKERY